MTIEKKTQQISEELTIQELDNVAGGARSAKFAATHERVDLNASETIVGRDGIASSVEQATDDFAAQLLEQNETGK